MYNREIKERFLSEYASGGKERTGCRAMFETFDEYERSLGKDLAEMSVDEMLHVLKFMIIGTYKTAADIQSRIKAYVRWCVQNCPQLQSNRMLLEVNIDDIDASSYFKKTIFKNEDDLIFELESVRRFDEGYTEGVVLLLAWIGIEQKDVLSIKKNDVDLHNRTIILNKHNSVIKFSNRIADVLRIYERTKEGSRPAGGSSRPVFRDDSFDIYIRKYCPRGRLGETPLTASVLRNSVGVINQLYISQGKESRLWNGNVIASGALYRVRELEKSGVDVFAFKNRELVIEAFGVSTKLYEIHWMYKNYKRAFNL